MAMNKAYKEPIKAMTIFKNADPDVHNKYS